MTLTSVGNAVAMAATDAVPLIDAVTVDHGPSALIAEFFLRAHRHLAESGLRLFLSRDFHRLKEVNLANQQTWFALNPIFDVDVGGINADNGYWIYAVDASGEIVATQGGRVYLIRKSLTDTLARLELFYPDPARQASPGERCDLLGPAAEAGAFIHGTVVWSGCTWFKPGRTRGRGFARVFPRMSRAFALAHFGTDYTISSVRESHVRGGVARAYGYSHVDFEYRWQSPWTQDFVAVDDPIALLWMPRQELVSDLARWLEQGPSAGREPAPAGAEPQSAVERQVDVEVHAGHAQ